MSELADWVGELDRSNAVNRVEIHMTLAEVYARLDNAPEGSDARLLDDLRRTLDRLLQREDDRSMRNSWFRGRDDMPPTNCGGIQNCGACMCSIERLEDRTKRDDDPQVSS
ncbi:hypothetical protein [Streptomyces mirabilis]